MKKIDQFVLSRPKLALKLLPHIPERYWEFKSRIYRRNIFDTMTLRVSAYKKFAHLRGANKYSDAIWKKLPEMDKSNYLEKFTFSELTPDQNLNKVSVWSQSSGYSGRPFYWPRLKGQDSIVTDIADLVLTSFFSIDSVPTLIIVGFSLGNWITGELLTATTKEIANRSNYPLAVITPGSDIDAVVNNIIDLGPLYEQIIIFGYPPMIRSAVGLGLAKNIKWSNYKPKVIVTGEGYSENWRDYLLKTFETGPDKIIDVMGFYGAADAGLIGLETPLSILIRRILNSDSVLCKKITGKDNLPSLVQYNPAIKIIETSDSGELLLSSLGGSPLLKYNIHDVGGTMTYSAMIDEIRSAGYNIDLAKSWSWPFCYVFGRSDGSISVDGANIYPSSIDKVIQESCLAEKLLSFRLAVLEEFGHYKFVVYLQCRADFVRTISNEEKSRTEKKIAKKILDSLLADNMDYAKRYSDRAKAIAPCVEIISEGSGVFVNEINKIKHRYVQATTR